MSNYVPDMTERYPEGDRYAFDSYYGPEYDPGMYEAACDKYGVCEGATCKWFIKCHQPEKTSV